MFLNRLGDGEKQSFLAIAHHIARSDADFSSEERVIVAQYCMEMRTPDVDYNSETFDLSEVLDQFTSEHRNLVVLELSVLAQADGKVSEKEDEILNEIADRFGTNPHLVVLYKEWAKNVMSLYLQGEALIHI